MVHTVSAFDAKTHFSNLLARVSNGEEILVTLRGKATARIIPANHVQSDNDLHTTIQQIRTLAKAINFQSFEFEEICNYKNIGRK